MHDGSADIIDNDDTSGITVYWRPGCGYCRSLFADLDRLGVVYDTVDIWSVPAGAAFVRSVARGNETVPTVRIGERALINPRADDVVRAAQLDPA